MTRNIFLLLLITLTFPAFAQVITLDIKDQPLNEALAGMAKDHSIEISFDDGLLSGFRCSAEGTFQSPEQAIRGLISGFPLELVKDGEVFVIYPVRQKAGIDARVVSGRVTDRISHEPLPFSHILINGTGQVADLTGSFSYRSGAGSLDTLRVSHLGYFILDTVVNPAEEISILLTPAMIGLTEVEIINAPVSRSGQIGEKAGQMKANQQVAGFLPGFGDNSVFNLLRLLPGILAAGEQTNDLIIWGSYDGQSKVMFDGFTIYSLKNFNDNISAFNPLMAKDIEVMKGGYDARYGDRVGGIVNITGKNGNMTSPSFTVNINNMTLNGMVEVPMLRNGSLVVAFRTTYYELYNPSDINSRLWRNRDRDTANDVDLSIIPDYRFSDMNIKYSAMIRGRDLFYISLYGGGDRFMYSIDEPRMNFSIIKETREKNRQGGGAVFYGRNWAHGSSTNFSLNFSGLKAEYSDNLTIEGKGSQFKDEVRDLDSRNVVSKFTIQADHRFSPGKVHRMEGGMAVKYNIVDLQEDTFNITRSGMDGVASRLVVYLQDDMALGGKVNIKAGLRLNPSFNLQKFYLEPRVSISYRPAARWKFNAAWGLYDQFIARSSVVDDQGNYRYLWTVCDNEDVPVLKGDHYVVGASYEYKEFTISLEGYYKSTTGLTRFVRNNKYHSEGIFQGNGRSYGMDVMIKKDYRGHSAWVAYSLSRTEELFEYFLNQEYRRAPQDQRHELKTALLLNFDPFFFSADYVFGSGFPPASYIQSLQQEEQVYSRLDVAFIYKFLDKKLKGEAGLSVLNVLNTKNIKYSNFERVPANQSGSVNLYAESIPITPALYLKLAL